MYELMITLQQLPALLLERFKRDERGATLVEYGLLVGLLAIVCIAAITLLGTEISNMFNRIGGNLSTVAN